MKNLLDNYECACCGCTYEGDFTNFERYLKVYRKGSSKRDMQSLPAFCDACVPNVDDIRDRIDHELDYRASQEGKYWMDEGIRYLNGD